MLGNVVEEPVSAVPPPLNNVDCVGKRCEAMTSALNQAGRRGGGGGGGGGENGGSFSPAVELIFQEFCPGL